MVKNSSGVDEPRVVSDDDGSAIEGKVVFSMTQFLWMSTMFFGACYGCLYFLSWQNIALFLVTTAGVLCFGHSLGMHRRLIHNSYECHAWLEYTLVYLGVLVGLGGPFGMIRTHDTRDWAQRQSRCHDYFSHKQSFLRDGWWQIMCTIKLATQPVIIIEDRISQNRFYHFLENTWMWQQLPWVVIFFYFGGLGAVCFGVCARVTACVFGHWLVGYFAHRTGHQDWHVGGAGVQGYNIGVAKWMTFGECWHNNHHAFPASAKLGLYKGQPDTGWWMLRVFFSLGWVWNLQTPETLAQRKELVCVSR